MSIFIPLTKALINVNFNEIETNIKEQNKIVHSVRKNIIGANINCLVTKMIPNNFELIYCFDFMCEN